MKESYSFSRLKMFGSCKYAYWQNYIEDKDKRPEKEGHGTSDFGNFCHDILERYGKGELAEWEMLDYYEAHFSENIKNDFILQMTENFCRDMRSKYYDDGYEFFKEFEGFPDFSIISAEKRFDVDCGDFRLNGKIDLTARDKDGKLIIVDYKSKSKFKSKAEREDYAKQLYIYAYAAKEIYGEYPSRLAFFMFRTNQWVWFDFDETRMQETLDWCASVVKEIEEEKEKFGDKPFEPIEETIYGDFNFYEANFCPFRSSCKYHH